MEMYGSKWMKRQGTSVMSDLLVSSIPTNMYHTFHTKSRSFIGNAGPKMGNFFAYVHTQVVPKNKMQGLRIFSMTCQKL
jgi:hypothetical protein